MRTEGREPGYVNLVDSEISSPEVQLKTIPVSGTVGSFLTKQIQ